MPRPSIHPETWTGEWLLIRSILAADWTPGIRRNWGHVPFDTIDWAGLPHLAWQFKLRPMIAAALREAGWPGTPRAVRTEIEAAERRVVTNAMWQTKLMATIANSAKDANVRILTLKGVTLSQHLYGTPFLREAFDLDFLVAPEEHDRFDAVLREAGCVRLTSNPPLSPRQTAILERYHHHHRYIHESSGVIVESHWTIDRNRHLVSTDFDTLWQRRTELPITNAIAAIPGPDDLVLYLATHATRHCWERWKWVSDLVALYRTMTADDFSRQRTLAINCGVAQMNDTAILFTHAVTGMALPQNALAGARKNNCARRLSAIALAASIKPLRRGAAPTWRAELALLHYRLAMKHTIAYWAAELASRMHREDDWYALRLPDRLIWLLYLLRPFGALQRGLQRFFTHFSNEGLKP